MQGSFRDMAQRRCNAESSFIECIREISGCSEEQAGGVLGLYLKEKLVKLGYNDGQFHIKHGAFLDEVVINRAVDLSARIDE